MPHVTNHAWPGLKARPYMPHSSTPSMPLYFRLLDPEFNISNRIGPWTMVRR